MSARVYSTAPLASTTRSGIGGELRWISPPIHSSSAKLDSSRAISPSQSLRVCSMARPIVDLPRRCSAAGIEAALIWIKEARRGRT